MHFLLQKLVLMNRYFMGIYRRLCVKFFLPGLTNKLRYLGKMYDVVHIAQIEAMKRFFCIDAAIIEKILDDQKLNVFDVGARGGIEKGFLKYEHLLNVILAEPDPEEATSLEKKGHNVIRSLIGGKDGHSVLNICRKAATSSTLQPTGAYIDYYVGYNTREKESRVDVVDRITLPMQTIESAIKQIVNQLDYLKLDTQGTELQILRGMGEFRPIIIRTEISFVPLYKDSSIFYDVGKLLYDMGYVMFDIRYVSQNCPSEFVAKTALNSARIPMHGDAWFMPDWTRESGAKIIKERDTQYCALMLIFGMKDILKYVFSNLETPNRKNLMAVIEQI